MTVNISQKESDYFREMTESKLFTDDEIIQKFIEDFEVHLMTAKRKFVLWDKLTEITIQK
jgi:hypothetical protein